MRALIKTDGYLIALAVLALIVVVKFAARVGQ